MNTGNFLICVASAAVVLFGTELTAKGAAPSPSVIRDTLETYVRAHPPAVVALGVIDHGRRKMYFIRGSRAIARLGEHTRFQIGSITKVFTATLLAQMVDAAQMNLSDPVQRYLPAGVTAPTYRGKPITLLSLATHTSGLPADPPNYGSITSPQQYTMTMLDAALSATKLIRAPGSHWGYSNFGFGVLGQAVADKAGVSYENLVKQRIINPLGMTHTLVAGSAATRHGMAAAYGYGGEPSQPEVIGRAMDPAGSMESDLNDMMRFLKANLDAPHDLLGRELAFAQQPRAPVPEWNMSIGLAWQTVLPATHHIAGDFGDLPAGWVEKGGLTNGYSSFIALSHACDCGFVAMTNVNDNDFQQVIAHAFSPRTAKMPILWALVKPEPSPYSGTYVLKLKRARQLFDILKYKGDLYFSLPASSGPLVLKRLGVNRYFLDGLNVAFTFHRDAGHVTGVTVAQNRRTLLAKKIR